ncbi:ATP-dependent DNA helicase PIF1-like protein [Tanacetum coccineum]
MLTANKRLIVGARRKDVIEIRKYAEWILKVRDGELGEAIDIEVLTDVGDEILLDAVDDSAVCTLYMGTEVSGTPANGKHLLSVLEDEDEASMVNKHCFEALDRSLRDIQRKNRYDTCDPFGNMTMVSGDGELGEENDGEVYIDVPEEILIDEADGPISSIVDLTYPNILDNINDPSYFKEKVVLASMNKVVDNINEHLLDKFPGEELGTLVASVG